MPLEDDKMHTNPTSVGHSSRFVQQRQGPRADKSAAHQPWFNRRSQAVKKRTAFSERGGKSAESGGCSRLRAENHNSTPTTGRNTVRNNGTGGGTFLSFPEQAFQTSSEMYINALRVLLIGTCYKQKKKKKGTNDSFKPHCLEVQFQCTSRVPSQGRASYLFSHLLRLCIWGVCNERGEGTRASPFFRHGAARRPQDVSLEHWVLSSVAVQATWG